MTILDTIGNTPVIELERYSPNKRVRILAKLEGVNPGGSVKDRIAKYMVEDAEKRGVIKDGIELIEATSGNTGIGLAMISAIKGYKFTALMSEKASVERRQILKTFGAGVILTDGDKGTNGALEVAQQMVLLGKGKYVMLNQFSNEMNVRAHFETTGEEIFNQVPEVTHFVAGMGTGGTIMGVGKRLKEKSHFANPPTQNASEGHRASRETEIKIVGVEPLTGSCIQGLRNMDAYVPEILDLKFLDNHLRADGEGEVMELWKDLIGKGGISAGISSAAALWGAIKVAKEIDEGVIVTLFADRADRYLSTGILG